MSDPKTFVLYTDGSCLGNPGAGGWATILLDNNQEIDRRTGGAPETTNNRMELMAVNSGLSLTNIGDNVEVHSDSKYVIDAFEKGWLANWKRQGWTRNGEPLKNVDLWKLLDKTVSKRNVTWVWVKGHQGNKFNELCDRLAVEAASNHQQGKFNQADSTIPMGENSMVEENQGTTPSNPEQCELELDDNAFVNQLKDIDDKNHQSQVMEFLAKPVGISDTNILWCLESCLLMRDKECYGIVYPCGGNKWCAYCTGTPKKEDCLCAKAFVMYKESYLLEEKNYG